LNALPLPLVVAILFAVLAAVSIATRRFILRRYDDDGRESLAREAYDLRIAATFAIFVGFALSISWGAVTAAQTAVEDQATAIHQTVWDLRNIPNQSDSAELMALMRNYATTVVSQDAAALRKGSADELPSAVSLDRFRDALVAHISGPRAAQWQVDRLLSDSDAISSASARVEAVANRVLPRSLATLVLALGVLSAIVMAVAAVAYDRPKMIFVWDLVAALCITTVVALAYPFALRSGTTLEALRTVAHQLTGG